MNENLNSIEQLVEELETAACTLLKPFLVEAKENVVDQTHVLDVGDGVKVYRIKAKAPQSARDAVEATNKCKLWRMQVSESSLNLNQQLLFDLGRFYERLHPIAVSVRPGKRTSPEKQKARQHTAAGSDALRQLKKRAADEAVARWMAENPDILEPVAILRASEELKISPRTLRNWRKPKPSNGPA